MSQIINKYYCLPMYVFRLSNRPTYLFETIYKEKYFVRKRFLFFSPSFLVEKHNKIKLWIEDTTNYGDRSMEVFSLVSSMELLYFKYPWR